jgi:hypothetical protein
MEVENLIRGEPIGVFKRVGGLGGNALDLVFFIDRHLAQIFGEFFSKLGLWQRVFWGGFARGPFGGQKGLPLKPEVGEKIVDGLLPHRPRQRPRLGPRARRRFSFFGFEWAHQSPAFDEPASA